MRRAAGLMLATSAWFAFTLRAVAADSAAPASSTPLRDVSFAPAVPLPLAMPLSVQVKSCDELAETRKTLEAQIADLGSELSNQYKVRTNRGIFGLAPLPGFNASVASNEQKQREASVAFASTLWAIVEFGCDGETTPDVPAGESKCGVSRDADYGTSTKKPIRVGGRVIDRALAYLQALRGPEGEGLRYLRDPFFYDGQVRFAVTYPGLRSPRFIYFDFNRWSEPTAVTGMQCGAPIGLTKP
jgi:hypothetical protein